MADALDLLRHDAIRKRIHGVAGGLRICWSAKDTAEIHDYIMRMKLETMLSRTIHEDARGMAVVDLAALRAKSGVQVRDAQPDDRDFAFVISSTAVDVAGDTIAVDGLDTKSYRHNPVFLNSHDAGNFPIATSSTPAVAGKLMTAIAHFPERGVSKMSDSVAAALRGRLVRGASIGFIPLKWAFSKDPARPAGIDFSEARLLEWSVCSIPCNPEALLLGAVPGGKAADGDSQRAARLREAERIAADARKHLDNPPPPSTPAGRLAEARDLRRRVLGGN